MSSSKRLWVVSTLLAMVLMTITYFAGLASGRGKVIDELKHEFGVQTSSEVQQIAAKYREVVRNGARLLEFAAAEVMDFGDLVEKLPPGGSLDTDFLRQKTQAQSMIIRGRVARYAATLKKAGIKEEDFIGLTRMRFKDNPVAANFEDWCDAHDPTISDSSLLFSYGDAFLVDIDGDGVQDVLHITQSWTDNGKTLVYVQFGSRKDGSFGPESYRGALQTNFYAVLPTSRAGLVGPFLRDDDGDGNLDLVQINLETGAKLVAKNDGTRTGRFVDSAH